MREFDLNEDAAAMTDEDRRKILILSQVILNTACDTYPIPLSPSIIFSALMTATANYAIQKSAQDELVESFTRLIDLIRSDLH